MSTLAKRAFMGLSVAERIQLVTDIWDTVAEMPEDIVLSDEQKQEISRRLDTYHQSPESGAPWDVVRERIRSR